MDSQNDNSTQAVATGTASGASLFAAHLEKLELLSLVTRRLTEPMPQIASAEKTLSQVWDILSKSLPSEGTSDIDYLSTLSSIIQRTASATKQIQSIEGDAVDLARKALAVETARKALLSGLADASGESAGDISPQTLATIEERLRLL